MKNETNATFTNAFGGHSKQYKRARPTYPKALFNWLLSQTQKPPGEIKVWDVGCGNGQAAIGIAPLVKHVHASDPSENQIKNAGSATNLTYEVSNCSTVGLGDSSVDLITAATAYHWFDPRGFFTEAERVLRPGGVIALFAYGKTHFPEGSQDVQNLVHTWSESTLGPFWDSRVANLYSDAYHVEMPFPTLANPPFSIVLEWSRDDLVAFIKSWSAYNGYVREHGEDPFLEIQSEFESLWDGDEIRRVEMELVVRVLKKRRRKKLSRQANRR